MQRLLQTGFDITFLKGPVPQYKLLHVVGEFDALLCGDDEITAAVLLAGKQGNLKYISKYGVGVDNVDISTAKQLGITVTNCPGVNNITVAELVFALLLSFSRNICLEYNITKAGGWQKLTGFDLYGKTIGVVGLGAVGKEVAKRAIAFGLKVVVATAHPNHDYIAQQGYAVCKNVLELAAIADIITLHVPLTKETNSFINNDFIQKAKPGLIIINTARGGLVDAEAIAMGLQEGKISGYLTDVLDVEPMPENYLLKDLPNVLITPHIGSRTYETVERQGIMAVENLTNMVSGNIEAYRSRLV
jgi:D-3-phosphoglycerate dehydrogenase